MGKAGSAKLQANSIKPVKKDIKKNNNKKKHKKFWLGFKIFLLLLLLGILAALIVFYFKFGDELLQWKSEAKNIIENSTVETFRSSETSMVYASNDSVIAKLKGDRDSYYLTFDEIPQSVKDALIVTEDRDFFEHDGVNLLSTFKAAALLVKSKIKGEKIQRGGSTITQQTAKLVFLTNAQTYERKIREIFLAFEMEKKYSKNQILEFYVNIMYFANGYYGIEAAARGYFSKSAAELTLPEVAFLCSIPNNPSLYDPFDNFDNTNKRKERILEQMLEAEVISAAEYTDASYEDIVLNPAETIKTQNYLTTYAVRCAVKELMKAQGFEFKYKFDSSAEEEEYNKNYDEVYNECHTLLYTGGYRVYTSLNKKKQKLLQKCVDEKLDAFKEKKEGIYTLQGAATCIDNKNGYVVAIVGGRKQKSITGYTLNRAFQSYRQPGSSFKPIAVYTPQLERNYTPDTIVDDTYFEGGPRNSNGVYSGKIPLRYAIEHSKNVVAWKLFEELTPKVGLSYVLKMNFNRIDDNDYYPAASLGGLTNGVTTVEMASAYATLENDGVFRDPTCVKKITDAEGNIIVNNNKLRKEKRVYEENAARMMTNILTGVLKSGTAAGHALSNMACAGKTGTTSDKKDGWFCGYTPYYSTAVWVGYDTPKTLSDLYGSTYPLSIWEDFMQQIHEGLEYKDFELYSGADDGDDNYYDNNDDNTWQETPDDVNEPDEGDISSPEMNKPEQTDEPDEPDDDSDWSDDEPDDWTDDNPDDWTDIPDNPDEPDDIIDEPDDPYDPGDANDPDIDGGDEEPDNVTEPDNSGDDNTELYTEPDTNDGDEDLTE